ncbi:MAG TPA: hypothetical protein VIM39_01370 [Candidatus Limnocylindrales bacterium]
MTLVIAGVVFVLLHLGNRSVLAYPFSRSNPGTRFLPLMRRFNNVIGICGLVLILMGLLFPSI